jgi:NAD(P)-dependent dehydrogenase (short-subunit alcohol dehydrogenase family)
MKAGGRIISIGSCVGERNMTPGLTSYAATKGAVKMFTQGLSREVGSRGITVNNVQPGPIDTDLNPAAGEWAVPQLANTALKRYGQVDEVASLVSFIARKRRTSLARVDSGRRHERVTARGQVECEPAHRSSLRRCFATNTHRSTANKRRRKT